MESLAVSGGRRAKEILKCGAVAGCEQDTGIAYYKVVSFFVVLTLGPKHSAVPDLTPQSTILGKKVSIDGRGVHGAER